MTTTILICIIGFLVLSTVGMALDSAHHQRKKKEAEDRYQEVRKQYLLMQSDLAKLREKVKPTPLDQFVKKINYYVRHRGTSYKSISTAIGAHHEYVSSIVRGRTRPSTEKAMAIMFELGFDEEEVKYFEQHLFPTLWS